jgi:hypothetical protein
VLPEDGSKVKFPRPRLPIWIPNTSAPPFGPGTTCESLLLLTKTRGGLLDAAAHKARDMVTWEEEGGREKRTGEEVVEKFVPERVTGESRASVGVVAVCARVGGAQAATRAQRN